MLFLSANGHPEIGAIYKAALLLNDRKGRPYTARDISLGGQEPSPAVPVVGEKPVNGFHVRKRPFALECGLHSDIIRKRP